ncbi:unnamed protein product [Polarella glacialis]|uniref:RRM domain-containing protein n=1 Tax=Polarella glacialis TaxID=89957 RepID=A0A813DDK0_POLGL|nr:unnamed protein product [Polarella glacialis]CAE8685693.1 unnamed protein product [Polarella glacialis]|mmetsp:Transcript_37092/g.59735  ORF Transcript_37092/g.59735 Transcript_37092/m.59735 type:complete len:149 (+) Transcript_37092:103-549(+)
MALLVRSWHPMLCSWSVAIRTAPFQLCPGALHRRYANMSHSADLSGLETSSPAAKCWPPRVRLRGLPFSINEDDLITFFDGFALAEASAAPSGRVVEILRRSDGLPTGQALVYFCDWADACRAREERQRSYMGSRWIEIYVDWSPEPE